jgi:hypothetical protein
MKRLATSLHKQVFLYNSPPTWLSLETLFLFNMIKYRHLQQQLAIPSALERAQEGEHCLFAVFFRQIHRQAARPVSHVSAASCSYRLQTISTLVTR